MKATFHGFRTSELQRTPEIVLPRPCPTRRRPSSRHRRARGEVGEICSMISVMSREYGCRRTTRSPYCRSVSSWERCWHGTLRLYDRRRPGTSPRHSRPYVPSRPQQAEGGSAARAGEALGCTLEAGWRRCAEGLHGEIDHPPSGVDRGDLRLISRRLNEKIDQVRSGDSNLPAMAGVTGFRSRVILLSPIEKHDVD